MICIVVVARFSFSKLLQYIIYSFGIESQTIVKSDKDKQSITIRLKARKTMFQFCFEIKWSFNLQSTCNHLNTGKLIKYKATNKRKNYET